MTKPLGEAIVGTWEFVDYRLTLDDGTVVRPFGKGATGYIMYTNDGYMSAQVQSGTGEDGKPLGIHIAYAGHFEVDNKKGILFHRIALNVSSNIDWLGAVQKRFAVIDETNHLIITTDINTAEFIWHRCDFLTTAI